MHVETALFFETAEEIYARVFRTMKPRTAVPTITVGFRRYANANSRIRLSEGQLRVTISDLLQSAPAPVQEALASILLAKLFGRVPEKEVVERYRRYLNRSEVRRDLYLAKQQRGRKAVTPPEGEVYNLTELFDELNQTYFSGELQRPKLGWSVKLSRTALGHFDPAHNTIVITSLFDSLTVPVLIVRYVLFHEMLHLKYPTEHSGTRRCVHTKAFKTAEKTFSDFDEARKLLRVLLGS